MRKLLDRGTVVSLVKDDCFSKSYPLLSLEIPWEKRKITTFINSFIHSIFANTVHGMRDKVEEIQTLVACVLVERKYKSITDSNRECLN